MTINIHYISHFNSNISKRGHTWVRNSGATWPGSSGRMSPVRLQWQSSGLQTADGLTGSMDPLPRWLVYVSGKLTLAVSRRPQSLMWASPWDAWASLWQGRWLPEARQSYALFDLESDTSFLLDSSSHPNQHDSVWEEISNDINTGRWGPLGALSETVYHNKETSKEDKNHRLWSVMLK